ncbi:MAG: hypothetical protein MZW92_58325, partial [Comamonadaceae bacterium]|nr:hypothetical protein [Comamonadaceae bacterium]
TSFSYVLLRLNRRLQTESTAPAKPKLVFTIDDAAFAVLYEEVLQHPETQVVFTGLNRKLGYYNDKARFLNNRTPVANITGVTPNAFFMRDQFAMLESILKRPVNKVAVLWLDGCRRRHP